MRFELGMKSLLLHKLRSGLTVLGIVFGVAAVISMLSIAEGTSRVAQEQIRALGATNIIIRSVKPSEEAAGLGRRPARDDPQLRAQVQRLRPDRRDHTHDPQGAADPGDPQADPPRQLHASTAAWSAPPKTTPTSTCCRWRRGGS